MRMVRLAYLEGKSVRALWGFVAASLFVMALEHFLFADSSWRSFVRPDGRYRIDVYAVTNLWPGDAPGYVYLRDREGHELAYEPVENVGWVEYVTWTLAAP